ncbi:MAG: hypothetical protein ACRDHO_05195 [Actinomycetota bacterium]|jgi:hypothetical protein
MEKRVSARVSPLMRGILVLAVVLVAAGAISPAFGAKALTKAKVKRIAVKQINKAAPTLSVLSATTAGSADNVMAATVPVGNSCVITGQTGGITAADSGNFCDVTFPKSVDTCVVGATPIHPNDDPAGQANVRKLGGAVVKVSRFDGTGGTPTRGLFSLYAVCPPA